MPHHQNDVRTLARSHACAGVNGRESHRLFNEHVLARPGRSADLIHVRAIKVSLTPPTGPVFLSLPGDVMLSAASGLKEKPTRIHTRFCASAESIEAAAALRAKAERPVIVSGSGVAKSSALDELAARLADAARGEKPYLIDAVVRPAPLGGAPQEL